MTPANAMKLNAVALYAITAVLLVAFYFQFALGELPCPLCLLQRVAFTALAVGPILTLRHGPRPGHYGLIILAALLGAAIASRQVLLHITPGDAGYGSALLGYHFYTWALLGFVAAIAASAAMLLFPAQFAKQAPPLGLIENAAVWLIFAVTLANGASALLECGFAWCPATPVHYELLH
ncbi:MAG: disulfide bond formation protein B [Hyphomicrobium sp.]